MHISSTQVSTPGMDTPANVLTSLPLCGGMGYVHVVDQVLPFTCPPPEMTLAVNDALEGLCASKAGARYLLQDDSDGCTREGNKVTVGNKTGKVPKKGKSVDELEEATMEVV